MDEINNNQNIEEMETIDDNNQDEMTSDSKETDSRGLLYVTQIPLHFYEEEILEHFSQFGYVTNVKICKSKLSGTSKGCGYVEFITPEMAKIASETTNNFTLSKKTVTATYVPFNKRPPFIFNSVVRKNVSPLEYGLGKNLLSRSKILHNRYIAKKRTLATIRFNAREC